MVGITVALRGGALAVVPVGTSSTSKYFASDSEPVGILKTTDATLGHWHWQARVQSWLASEPASEGAGGLLGALVHQPRARPETIADSEATPPSPCC